MSAYGEMISFGHGAEAGMVKVGPIMISLMCYRQLGGAG